MPKKKTGKTVTFRAKSSWQKDDCISCTSESTLEAICGIASVRCCESERCKKRAADLARQLARA
jgi:hypothetical protein